MDTEAVQPARAASFYGSQKQPRQWLDPKLRSLTPGPRSPAFGASRRFLPSAFSYNSQSKRQHSPLRSYGMSNALRDVKNTTECAASTRTDTPRPESTRTWGQARTDSLSVEKKFKSISIDSEMAKSAIDAISEDILPVRYGNRRTYSRRSSGGQQSGIVPRELFCSDIENQDPGAKRGPAASNGLVLLDEDWTIRDKESQSGSAPDVMSSDETQSVITFGSQGRSKSIKSPIPLMNLKNSCYMNSVVQSLIAFPEFIVSLQRYLNSESHATRNDENSNELMDRTNSQAENPIGVRFPIIKALVKLFLDYETERRRESNEEKTTDMRYRLERLKEKVGNQSKQFLSDNQQDAGEFFSFLMDAASDEFKRAKSPSLIDNWMAMTTETRMTCCTCRRVSDPVVTHSTSTYLAVPEQSEDRDDDPELNLQRLLTNSLQEVDRREYPCPAEGCEGRETDASRTIAKLPKILVIQMSRISLAGEKIERPVEVDHTLSITSGATPVEEDELTAVTDKRCVRYELKSVICHIGPSTTKGHYYSLTRNHVNGSWYDCDDHEIKRVNFDQVCADGRIYGYCFFYEKID